MNAVNEHRKTVRLNIDHGILILRAPGRAALACSLHDLSATGCRGKIDLESTDMGSQKEWLPSFVSGTRLDLELSKPPLFKALKLQGAVTHVEHDPHNNPELGIVFVEPTPVQQAALEHAMQAAAADKIKHSHHAPFAPSEPTPPEVTPPAPEQPGDSEWSHEKLAQKPFAEVLAMLHLLSPQQAQEALRLAEAEHLALPRYLLKQRLVKPDELCRALALHSGLPMINLKDRKIPDELARIYSYLTMMRYDFVPFALSKEMLCVAAGAPMPLEATNELSRACTKEVLVFLAPVDQIRSHLFKLRPRAPFKERQHPRLKAAIPVSFQYCDENGINLDEVIHTGQAQDVSEGGFLVETPPPEGLTAHALLEHRSQVRLEFSWHPQEIHALCAIRHIETPSRPAVTGHAVWLLGLQIVNLPPHDLELLHEICAKAGIEQRTRSYTPPTRHG